MQLPSVFRHCWFCLSLMRMVETSYLDNVNSSCGLSGVFFIYIHLYNIKWRHFSAGPLENSFLHPCQSKSPFSYNCTIHVKNHILECLYWICQNLSSFTKKAQFSLIPLSLTQATENKTLTLNTFAIIFEPWHLPFTKW